VIKGWEYEKMLESVNAFAGEFTSLKVGLPLLSSKRDFSETVEALMAGILQDYDVNTAVVLMGHGTEHAANEAYNRLLSEFNHKGCENVFVGTVEGTPTLEEVMEKAISKAYKKAVLLPLMVVAGDHAQNDLAGDGEDSWKSIFTNAGFEVECVLKGLGEYEKIRDMYVRHVWDAVNTSAVCDKGRKNSISKQNGGEYWRNKNYSFFQHRECECFPCHKTDDIEDFNCLFCYCPLYTLGDKCGGDFIYTQSGIKNCVNCSVPHKRENYGLIISKYPLIAKLAAKKQEEV
jgi:Zn-finger protein